MLTTLRFEIEVAYLAGGLADDELSSSGRYGWLKILVCMICVFLKWMRLLWMVMFDQHHKKSNIIYIVHAWYSRNWVFLNDWFVIRNLWFPFWVWHPIASHDMLKALYTARITSPRTRVWHRSQNLYRSLEQSIINNFSLVENFRGFNLIIIIRKWLQLHHSICVSCDIDNLLSYWSYNNIHRNMMIEWMALLFGACWYCNAVFFMVI